MILPRLPVLSTTDGPNLGDPNPTPEALAVPETAESWLPEGIRASRAAFVRDLMEMIEDQDLRGKWVAYHGEERIGVAEDDEPLIRECIRRGLRADESIVDVIEPKPSEPEEVDFPSSWR